VRKTGAALFVAGLACTSTAVLPLVHVSAEDAPGSGLGSFALNGFATGVQIRVGEPSYCYTTTAGKNGCEGAIPESTASLQSGPNGSALAAVAWPGALAADLGDLHITASNGQLPSQATVLNDPVRAEVRTGQNPDTVSYDSVPGSTMKASAKPTATSAEAAVQSTTAAVGTFGPSSSSASSTLTGPKAAIAKAKSNLQDIDLGGVVHIGSVQSEATATTDGTTATVKGGTKVTGATVAGVPVTIDESGVSVNGSGLAIKTLTDQVNSALSQAGITLRVSEPQGKPVGAGVSYTSGALVAVFAPQAGYQFSVTLGGANVTATSVPAITFTPPTTTGGTTGTTGTTGGGATTGGAGTGGVSVGGTSGLVSGTTGDLAPTTGAPTDVPGPQTLTPQLAGSSAKLRGPVKPWLVVTGLLGVGLMLAGLKRLPDRVLEALPPVCPLEEKNA
jgi:hypothetical protein